MKHYITLSFALALLTGCGITGGTREFKLNYDLDSISGCENSVVLSECSTAQSVGINQAVGAYNWGKFGESDRKKLEKSLASTLEQLNEGSVADVEIRVFLHRYAMSFSNDEIAILAVVDWCIELHGFVIYDEVFYAADYSGDSLFGLKNTLGGYKNKINKAIVGHIADQTFSFLCEYRTASRGKYIYNDPISALSVLPKSVDSSAMFFPGQSMSVYITGASANTFFGKVIQVNRIDWKSLPNGTDELQ